MNLTLGSTADMIASIPLMGRRLMVADTPEPSVAFSIIYDGDALAEHTMDVRDLAPALLALGEAFETANSLLNGDKTSIELKISATTPSCFDISLYLTQMYRYATGALTGDLVTSAANLKTFMIGGPGATFGVIKIIKALKGRKAEKTRIDNNQIRFTAPGIDLMISEDVDRLYDNPRIQRLLAAVVAPLNKPGIDSIDFREGPDSIEVVDKQDLPAFDVGPGTGEVDETFIPNRRLTIIAPNLFDPKGSWRLHDGNSPGYYLITDNLFVEQVFQRHNQFSVGDILVCDVRLIHMVGADGRISKRAEIQRVLRHISAGTQIQMFNDENTDESQTTS